MTTVRQIITLEVEVDLDIIPIPEHWDWPEVAKQLGGSVSIEVLATGQPRFERDKPAPVETPSETIVRRLFGTPKVDPARPDNEGRN